MPRITEQKKPAKPQPKTPEEVKTTPGKEPEPKVVVFRLFECLVRLEEASNQISHVGILPGPEDKANVFQTKLKTAKAAVDDILKDYQAAWGVMMKS